MCLKMLKFVSSSLYVVNKVLLMWPAWGTAGFKSGTFTLQFLLMVIFLIEAVNIKINTDIKTY